MKGSIYPAMFITASLLFFYQAQAQTTATTKQNDVSEVVVSGQQNPSDWFRAESQHFIVYSDTKQKHVSQLLNKLERFDYLLRLYAKANAPTKAEPKLTLYYQSRVRDLKKIVKDQPAYTIGFYNSCAQGVQAFATHMYYGTNPDVSLEKQPENEGLSYIFEAYARHFLYRHTEIRTPNWYIDGFAKYFANTRFSDSETVLGIPPQSIRDYLLYLSSGNNYYSLNYKDILLDNESKGHNVAGEAGVRLEFQAKAWALTHYILSSSENIQHFDAYNKLVAAGLEQTKAFEQSFGFPVKKLGNHLWKYKRKSAEGLKLNLTAGAEQEIQFSSLPISANKLMLADAAIKSCPTRALGQELLQNIMSEAKKYPTSDYAQTILSRAQINWGDAKSTIPYLTSVAKGDNAEAFYLLGNAQLRIANERQGDEQKNYLKSAQDNFLKASNLNSSFAEAFYGCFQTGLRLQDTPSKETLSAAIKARTLAPEVSGYLRAAALSHAYLKELSETQATLDLMARNKRDPQMAEWANIWQAKLNTGVTRAALITEMHQEVQPDTRFTEWTLASDSVMQEVQRSAEMAAVTDFITEQRVQQIQSQRADTSGLIR
ncbi:MAG: hypothetical protein EOO52_06415 [Gammaproteobacteria bacterium]|nr:MAG: hypothetical protein EOO52_06415 [Gammaproteobacteria bacterium]